MNSKTEAASCACPDCKCEINDGHRVVANDKEYCSDACATGHVTGEGCCNGSCDCQG